MLNLISASYQNKNSDWPAKGYYPCGLTGVNHRVRVRGKFFAKVCEKVTLGETEISTFFSQFTLFAIFNSFFKESISFLSSADLRRTWDNFSFTDDNSEAWTKRKICRGIYSPFTLTWLMFFLQTLSFHCFQWLKEKNSTWKSLMIIQVRVNAL